MSKSIKSARLHWLIVNAIVVVIVSLVSQAPVGFPLKPVQRVQASTTAISLPPGFVDEPVVEGLLSPRAFAFLPDGRILITERGNADSNDTNFASIRVYKNSALLPERAYSLGACGDGERGLLGLAVDPKFAQNGYLYIYYTRFGPTDPVCGYYTYQNNKPGPRNRVSRLTMVGDVVVADSERILIDNIQTDSGIHNAGDLQFGPDGSLYVSVGDSQVFPSPAQSLDRINGKILRIVPNPAEARGYSTSGNPYDAVAGAHYCGTSPPETGSGPCREVFASGLRNPFRFTVHPTKNSLFVGDVGGSAWEEIDEVVAGGNYGYPVREGPCSGNVISCTLPQPPSGFDEPVYAYSHTDQNSNFDSAVIGGAFYTGTITGTPYPPSYIGDYFFMDVVRGFIRQLTYNTAQSTWSAVTPEFATGVSAIGLKTGLDGNLYYIRFRSETERDSDVRRIRYQPNGNQPPQASLTVLPTGGPLSTVYTFSAAESVDPDNNVPLIYRWQVGNEAVFSTTAATLTRTFNSPGTRIVSLTVLDSGTPPQASAPVSVTVYPGNLPPTATIVLTNTTAPTRTLYHAGDTWQFGVANASDDTALPEDAFRWNIEFHHRQHQHPFQPNLAGDHGEFQIPPVGEPDPVVWYRVTLRITDSVGQTASVIRDLYPETTTLTLRTVPPGGTVEVDGASFGTDYVITRVVGIQSALSVPMTRTICTTSYQFVAWSQGGSRTQVITVPETDETFTATFAKASSGAIDSCKRKYLPLIRR